MYENFDFGATSNEARALFDSRFWYLVQLKPSGLERAKLNLKRQNFPTFMPDRSTSTRKRGKIVPSSKPLFPGYLFAQVKPEQQNWRAINSTYGVARLVSLRQGKPTTVPADFIAELHRRTDNNGMLCAPENLKPGDKTRIIAGPFAQQIAEIEAIDGKDRVVLLMQIMGRAVRTQVSASQLESI